MKNLEGRLAHMQSMARPAPLRIGILPFIGLLVILFLILPADSKMPNGFYQGLERMCWKGKDGKRKCYDSPRKWYHCNTLKIRNDSVFLYKAPLEIRGKDTLYSASDGAFFYYFGHIQTANGADSVILYINNCDYCLRKYSVDSLTGFRYPSIDTVRFKIAEIPDGVLMNGVTYQKMKETPEYFKEERFYFDENSIYRVNPQGLYSLMSKALVDAVKESEIPFDSDSLFVLVTRRNLDKEVIETLDPSKFDVAALSPKLLFISIDSLTNLVNDFRHIVRFVEFGEIIDYMHAARITLKYDIAIPLNVKGIREKEYSLLMEYDKKGDELILDGKHMSWGNISQ
jgi:hypothetical protein